MRIIQTAVVSLFAAWSLSACTTTEMAAKSGPGEVVTAQDNRCAGYESRRSECEDQVGCGWDNAKGTCARQ